MAGQGEDPRAIWYPAGNIAARAPPAAASVSEPAAAPASPAQHAVPVTGVRAISSPPRGAAWARGWAPVR
jgi:hypothetical protein